MNIVTKINEWKNIRKSLEGKKIGFVPTMGNLHSGHISLCQYAKKQNDLSIVSIFINPTQFNQTEDYDQYPRTLDNDKLMLDSEKIDYLFLPDAQEIYPDHYSIRVTETELSTECEGYYRPGHFNGMLTIVLKLLNLVQPARAYFGEKDYQQLLLIKKMVGALFLPIEIISCPTIRAANGLAMSSRNNRLNLEQQMKAATLSQLLQSNLSIETISKKLNSLGFKVDYVIEKWGRRLAAVWLNEVRLIDNVPMT